MAKNDKKREMVEKTRSQREIMRAIIIEARKVLPTLAAIAKKSEFELTISNDKHGFTLTCYTGEPLNLDGEAPANPIEIETIEIPTDIAEGVDVAEAEQEIILHVLASTDGNRSEAAEKLGISERTLRSKIKKYRIYQRDIEIEKDKERIQQALEECGGDSELAAKKLGLTTKAIRRRITVYGL